MEAIFVSGSPLMVDYTPESAVAAGDIIIIGSSIRIAHTPIAAGALGSVSAGGAIYDLISDGTDPSDNDNAYVQSTGHKVSTAATSAVKVGVFLGAQTLADGGAARVAVDLQIAGT